MSNINILLSTLLTEKVDWEVVEKLYLYALQSTVEDPNNTLTMNLSGNIEVDIAKLNIVRYMSGIDANDNPKFPDLHITVKDNNYAEPIQFESEGTKEFVLQFVGGKTGGGVAVTGFAGEVTYKLASLYSFGDVYGNSKKSLVTKFNEFLYFANTTIPGMAFQYFPNMTEITLPPNLTTIGSTSFRATPLRRIIIPSKVTSIGNSAFHLCTKLSIIILQPITPPSLGGDNVFVAAPILVIYVPDESVDAYKQANIWSNYAKYIRPMSEM